MINGYISCKNPVSFCFLYFLYFMEFDRRNWKKSYNIRIAQDGLDSTSATGKLAVGFLSLCAFPLLVRKYVGLPILSPLRVKLFYLWFSCGLFEQEKYQVASDWSYMMGQISGRNLPSTMLANAPPTTSHTKRSQMNPGSLIQASKKIFRYHLLVSPSRKPRPGVCCCQIPPVYKS